MTTQSAIEAAKEAPAKLQERLRGPIPTRVVGTLPRSGVREVEPNWELVEQERIEAADALDAAEARIAALTQSSERESALEEAATIIDPDAFNSAGFRPEESRQRALQKAREVVSLLAQRGVDLLDPDENAEIAMSIVNSLPHMPTMAQRYQLSRAIAVALKSTPAVAEDVVEQAMLAFWNTWPSFREWWLANGHKDISTMPPEPFENALAAANLLRTKE